MVPASSATGGKFTVGESLSVGERIALNGDPEMAALGSALHHCLALSDVMGEVSLEHVQRLLAMWDVETTVDAVAVTSQIKAFLAWLQTRWPSSALHVEVPVESSRGDGSYLRGRMDLLVETNDGWILVDHKSNPGGSFRDTALVQQYGPQLKAYADAIYATTGRSVLEKWIYFPVAGRVTRVDDVSRGRTDES